MKKCVLEDEENRTVSKEHIQFISHNLGAAIIFQVLYKISPNHTRLWSQAPSGKTAGVAVQTKDHANVRIASGSGADQRRASYSLLKPDASQEFAECRSTHFNFLSEALYSYPMCLLWTGCLCPLTRPMLKHSPIPPLPCRLFKSRAINEDERHSTGTRITDIAIVLYGDRWKPHLWGA